MLGMRAKNADSEAPNDADQRSQTDQGERSAVQGKQDVAHLRGALPSWQQLLVGQTTSKQVACLASRSAVSGVSRGLCRSPAKAKFLL